MQTSKQDTIDTLLDNWDQARQEGKHVTPEEICAGHPALADEVTELISAVEWVNRQGKNFFGGASKNQSAGRKLGRYELQKILGAGGYGTVWKALDSELERHVAIKLPHDQFASEADEEQFVAEAKKLATLQHPNIVAIYDIGRDGDEVFIVTQLVEGSNLANLPSDLSKTEAVKVVRQIAWALGYAHRKGIIHRDVKPANILIDESGKPLLADFGIAISPSVNDDVTDTRGTMAYKSPEQTLAGDVVNEQSDIFSLGVVAYELLTGQLPFEAGDQGKFNRVPTKPPKEIDSSILSCESDAILKALASHPYQRQDSADQFAQELTAVGPIKNWLYTIAGALSVLVLGLLCALPWLTGKNERPDQRDASQFPLSHYTFNDSANRLKNTGIAKDSLKLRRRGNTQFVPAPTNIEAPFELGDVAKLGLGASGFPDDKPKGNGFTTDKHELASGTSFSISFWFCRTESNKIDTLLHLGEARGFGLDSVPQLSIWIDKADNLRILSYHRFGDVKKKNAQLNVTYPAGETLNRWSHLKVSFDCSELPTTISKGTFRAYIDNKLICEKTEVSLSTIIRNTKSRLCIGSVCKDGDQNRWFSGYMDEIQIMSSAK